MNIFSQYQTQYKSHQAEEMTVQEYLDLCKKDPAAYATAGERMLTAIGEPEFVNTKDDPRLSRIFTNRIIKRYPAFDEFYGIETVIEQIVNYFKHAAQGLEERKNILYLLGPVGSSKSSLAEKLKELMETVPFYAIKGSPVHESPLGLFNKETYANVLQEEYNIPDRYLTHIMSPWAAKRLSEFGGDITKFKVVKIWPSRLNRIGITKVEPGDENNNDVSSLIGKVDIRKLEDFSQDDPDAYSYSGGLCLANQGLLEFVELFKSPIKMLHPLLTATQEGNYNGTEGAAIPFSGIIIAHSNESEWQTFRNNKNNEAFLDRVCVVKVPYCLRVTEETKIYEKLLRNSSLAASPRAPGTLEMMAQFAVLTRLKEPENSTLFSKMKIYDGENLKDTDPKAKPLQEYRDNAGVDEGMAGLSTRFAYKILSKVFNYDSQEVAANPVHLMYILEKQIEQEQFSTEVEEKYIDFIKSVLAPKFGEFIGKEIQTAYLESYSEFGQNIFDKYVNFADSWCQNNEFRDPDTGEMYDRDILNAELEKIEKSGLISNPKDFRHECVNYCLRQRAANSGKNPDWRSYEKIRVVIEARIFTNTEELLPIVSFSTKGTKEEQTKHDDFVGRMVTKGYTRKQVELLVNWFVRYRKHS